MNPPNPVIENAPESKLVPAFNLHQRLVCILIVALAVFASTASYTFSRTKLYESSALIQRAAPTPPNHPRVESDGLIPTPHCCI